MDRKELAERVVHTADTRGVFAAVGMLSDQEDTSVYTETMRLAYWNRKDLDLALAVATAGVSRLLADATHCQPKDAYEIRSEAKGLLYDVASFSWVGWGEPGISISVEQRRIGLEAAESNVELAQSLDKGDLALSRAHWMVGAHLLTDARYGQAETTFLVASSFASDAGSIQDQALCTSFAALSALAGGDESATDALDGALGDLRGTEDGEMFVAQVTTCMAVLNIEQRSR